MSGNEEPSSPRKTRVSVPVLTPVNFVLHKICPLPGEGTSISFNSTVLGAGKMMVFDFKILAPVLILIKILFELKGSTRPRALTTIDGGQISVFGGTEFRFCWFNLAALSLDMEKELFTICVYDI